MRGLEENESRGIYANRIEFLPPVCTNDITVIVVHVCDSHMREGGINSLWICRLPRTANLSRRLGRTHARTWIVIGLLRVGEVTPSTVEMSLARSDETLAGGMWDRVSGGKTAAVVLDCGGLGVAGVFFWVFGKCLSSKSLSRWESVQGVSVPFYELSYTLSPSVWVLRRLYSIGWTAS